MNLSPLASSVMPPRQGYYRTHAGIKKPRGGVGPLSLSQRLAQVFRLGLRTYPAPALPSIRVEEVDIGIRREARGLVAPAWLHRRC